LKIGVGKHENFYKNKKFYALFCLHYRFLLHKKPSAEDTYFSQLNKIENCKIFFIVPKPPLSSQKHTALEIKLAKELILKTHLLIANERAVNSNFLVLFLKKFFLIVNFLMRILWWLPNLHTKDTKAKEIQKTQKTQWQKRKTVGHILSSQDFLQEENMST
jgi:hypothetical protein